MQPAQRVPPTGYAAPSITCNCCWPSVQEYLHPLLVLIGLQLGPAQCIPQRLKLAPLAWAADAARRHAKGWVRKPALQPLASKQDGAILPQQHLQLILPLHPSRAEAIKGRMGGRLVGRLSTERTDRGGHAGKARATPQYQDMRPRVGGGGEALQVCCATVG